MVCVCVCLLSWDFWGVTSLWHWAVSSYITPGTGCFLVTRPTIKLSVVLFEGISHFQTTIPAVKGRLHNLLKCQTDKICFLTWRTVWKRRASGGDDKSREEEGGRRVKSKSEYIHMTIVRHDFTGSEVECAQAHTTTCFRHFPVTYT